MLSATTANRVVGRVAPPLLTALLLGALSGAARAEGAGRNGLIAFWSSDRRPQGVYTMRADGSAIRALRRASDYDRGPAWSPDGRRLAFHCGSWICITGSDGSERRRLARGFPATVEWEDAPPTWAPDGTRIAFAAKGGIATIQIDGRDRRLIRGTESGDFEPAWAPDGRTMAVIHVSAGGPPGIPTIRLDLILIDISTGRRRQLGGDWSFERPAWSPDGTTIVYARDENAPCRSSCPPYSLYALAVEPGGGAGEIRLTRAERDTSPAYSPDGTRIVFERGGAILVAAIDGTNVRRLTSGRSPAWQPRCTISGTEGADRLRGSPGRDLICGLGGDDVIDAGAGDDVVIGGNGNDRIRGSAGRDRLFGGFGRDAIVARDGTVDVVDGGPGLDTAQADASDVATAVP